MVGVVKTTTQGVKNDDKRRGRGCVIDGFHQPDCFCGVIRKVLEMKHRRWKMQEKAINRQLYRGYYWKRGKGWLKQPHTVKE